jgi:hypothetical protein
MILIENGCKEPKCPCRMWVNCLNYVDMQRLSLRLRKKEYDLYKWYINNFLREILMRDRIVNGLIHGPAEIRTQDLRCVRAMS